MDKFRLINDGKIVGYEKHKYWTDPLSKDNSSIHIYHSRTGHGLSWKDVSMNDEEKNYIKHDKKDMFTGLLDAKDNEIYQGDILELYDLKEEEPFVVNDFVDSVYYLNSVPMELCKIIGNIYENK